MSRARTFADLATASEAGNLGKRNILVNGNMQVSQRGTSKTDVPSHSTNYYPLIDQIAVESNNSAGRLTMSQADVTDLAGFTKAMKLDCTTADTSIAADEYFLFEKRIEGQDLQSLGHGTSDAKPVTISFYVKGTAKTYMCELQNYDASVVSTNQFAVTTSWNRISITVPANTSNAISNDNDQGFWMNFWIHAGSTFTGGTYSANAWQSLVNNKRASGIGSFFSSTDNELFITGLQMEIGEVATPFEHESFGDNLARCQRYFYAPVPKGSANSYFGTGFNYNSSLMLGFLHHPVEMRANPTLTSSDGTSDFGFLRNGAEDTFNDVGLNSTNTKGTSIINNSDISGTGGQAGGLYINDTTNAFIYLSAEL